MLVDKFLQFGDLLDLLLSQKNPRLTIAKENKTRVSGFTEEIQRKNILISVFLFTSVVERKRDNSVT